MANSNDPKAALIQELVRRRAFMTPDKQALVDELVRRQQAVPGMERLGPLPGVPNKGARRLNDRILAEAGLNEVADEANPMIGLGHGIQQMIAGDTAKEKVAGGNTTFNSALNLGAEAVPAGLIEAPLPTARALVAGMLAQKGIKKTAEFLGVDPVYAEALGNLASIPVAVKAGNAEVPDLVEPSKKIAYGTLGAVKEGAKAIPQAAKEAAPLAAVAAAPAYLLGGTPAAATTSALAEAALAAPKVIRAGAKGWRAGVERASIYNPDVAPPAPPDLTKSLGPMDVDMYRPRPAENLPIDPNAPNPLMERQAPPPPPQTEPARGPLGNGRLMTAEEQAAWMAREFPKKPAKPIWNDKIQPSAPVAETPQPETPQASPAPAPNETPTSGNLVELPPGKTPVIQHKAIAQHEQRINDKVANIHTFLTESGVDPSQMADALQQMSPEQRTLLARQAWEYGKAKGAAVGKTPYKGLEGDTLGLVLDKLRGAPLAVRVEQALSAAQQQ